jgi:glycosyltransferase involved in cell wall biosynthesis
VVEALHSGLPLLVSHRIGNHAEAIREGENGWTVDPVDEASVLRGIRAAFGASPEALRAMGEVSRAQARRTWRSEPAIDAFLDQAGVW